MKMFNIKLIKVLIAICVSSFVIFEVYKSVSETNLPANTFFENTLLNITAINIKAGGHIELKKNLESQWFIENPFKERANNDLIESLISQIKSSSTELIPNQDSKDVLKKYGLNDPLASIHFLTKDKTSIDILLSSTKAYNESYYLSYKDSKTGKTFLLVSNFGWVDFILKRPTDFLQTEGVFAFKVQDLKKIDLSYSTPLIKATKGAFFKTFFYIKNKSLWRLSLGPKFNSASVHRLLELFKALEISGYDTDILSAKKDKEEILKIHFLNQDQTSDTFTLFKHFKKCSNSSENQDCQLATFSSKKYPFWLSREDLAPIINQTFVTSD